MDRAHRLGQRKVVNVHRLIMRGTLEEKIMSLQKFKVSVANAVINAENASLKTMNTDQLLDLFTSAQGSTKVRVFSCFKQILILQAQRWIIVACNWVILIVNIFYLSNCGGINSVSS